jgi:hypothetical protein
MQNQVVRNSAFYPNLVTPPIYLKEAIESQMEQAHSHLWNQQKSNGYTKMSAISIHMYEDIIS